MINVDTFQLVTYNIERGRSREDTKDLTITPSDQVPFAISDAEKAVKTPVKPTFATI